MEIKWVQNSLSSRFFGCCWMMEMFVVSSCLCIYNIYYCMLWCCCAFIFFWLIILLAILSSLGVFLAVATLARRMIRLHSANNIALFEESLSFAQ